MEIDSRKKYVMPLIIGQIDRELTDGVIYKEEEGVILQYETEPEAISALLPDCYHPTERPIVTVAFAYNDGVEIMAGRGYRIATVLVEARYDGEQDHIEGNFALVMFEDDTLPIVLGRELLGIPKLYADISPIKMFPNGHLRCEASLWGHLLFGVDLSPLVKQDDSVCSSANEKPGPPLLGYKYIPSLEGDPDAAYPTSTTRDMKLERMWLGKSGSLFFGDPSYEDVGFITEVIGALKKLPVHQVIGVSRSQGTTILRADLSRRLH